MKCYHDRKDFMAGHVLSEYYKYCQDHTCKGVLKKKKKEEKIKALVNPDQLGRAS